MDVFVGNVTYILIKQGKNHLTNRNTQNTRKVINRYVCYNLLLKGFVIYTKGAEVCNIQERVCNIHQHGRGM
jgi:hypothetical protein